MFSDKAHKHINFEPEFDLIYTINFKIIIINSFHIDILKRLLSFLQTSTINLYISLFNILRIDRTIKIFPLSKLPVLLFYFLLFLFCVL